jgi:hypothetical protein
MTIDAVLIGNRIYWTDTACYNTVLTSAPVTASNSGLPFPLHYRTVPVLSSALGSNYVEHMNYVEHTVTERLPSNGRFVWSRYLETGVLWRISRLSPSNQYTSTVPTLRLLLQSRKSLFRYASERPP